MQISRSRMSWLAILKTRAKVRAKKPKSRMGRGGHSLSSMKNLNRWMPSWRSTMTWSRNSSSLLRSKASRKVSMEARLQKSMLRKIWKILQTKNFTDLRWRKQRTSCGAPCARPTIKIPCFPVVIPSATGVWCRILTRESGSVLYVVCPLTRAALRRFIWL